MKNIDNEYLFVAGITILLIGTGVSILGDAGDSNEGLCQEAFDKLNNSGIVSWENFELVDVNSCNTYQISELDKPVLVENFAIWCSICDKQQNEVKKFHKDSDVKTVALDIDPNENSEQVKRHTEDHGFDWRYSVASAKMTEDMVEEFGGSLRLPPRAPMVLVCEDGARKLPDGVKPVSKLQEEVEKGC